MKFIDKIQEWNISICLMMLQFIKLTLILIKPKIKKSNCWDLKFFNWNLINQ